MKILSFKRLLGLAAIYGAVQYARKHGGAKNALNELRDKAMDLADQVKGQVAEVASEARSGIGSAYGSEDCYSSSSSGHSSTGDGFGGSTGNGRRSGY